MLLKTSFNKRRALQSLIAVTLLLVESPAYAEVLAPPPAAPGTDTPSTDAPPSDVPSDGPTMELPDDPSAEESETPDAIPDHELVRGLRDHRFAEASESGSVLGGYGELHFNLELPEGGDSHSTIDLHRLVFFAAHKFSDAFRLYAEVEIEHAFSSLEDLAPGEIEVEQAFIDWKPWGKALQLRAGIVLVPMGIVNQWHEPPVFHGVERPTVDELIIPSTWREGGIGLFGDLGEALRYELYLVGGLNPRRFSAESSVREGRQSVADATANGLALTGRVEWEPTLGVVVGGSAYYGHAGPNADGLQRLVARDPSTGALSLAPLELSVPVLGLAVDGRVRRGGFEARALFATFSVGDTAALRQSVDPSTGDSLGLDVGARSLGAYGELAYDVLRLATQTEQQLLPFARVEYWDTAASLSGRPRTPSDDALRGTNLAFGVTYRPIPQVVLKADFIRRSAGGARPAANLVDLGIGWMF